MRWSIAGQMSWGRLPDWPASSGHEMFPKLQRVHGRKPDCAQPSGLQVMELRLQQLCEKKMLLPPVPSGDRTLQTRVLEKILSNLEFDEEYRDPCFLGWRVFSLIMIWRRARRGDTSDAPVTTRSDARFSHRNQFIQHSIGRLKLAHLFE